MITAEVEYVGINGAAMATCELPKDDIIRLTGAQKVALMLRRANYKDRQIAQKMGITRESANRLIQRALRAEREVRRVVEEFIEGGHLGPED